MNEGEHDSEGEKLWYNTMPSANDNNESNDNEIINTYSYNNR